MSESTRAAACSASNVTDANGGSSPKTEDKKETLTAYTSQAYSLQGWWRDKVKDNSAMPAARAEVFVLLPARACADARERTRSFPDVKSYLKISPCRWDLFWLDIMFF